MSENLSKIVREDKNLSRKDAYAKCRKLWHALKDKSEYVEKADKDKERY